MKTNVCIAVIDEAEYVCNHDESKDETEFRSKSVAVMQYTAAQVHVLNKEDVKAMDVHLLKKICLVIMKKQI